jgi:AGCS family alanine or glycine:cation symporter
MLQFIVNFITLITEYLWGGPLLILIMLTGLFYATKLCFKILYNLKKAIKTKTDKNLTSGEMPLINCLLTAMAGTIGSGNIVGVATAISVGGPGSLFWIWIVSIICMIVKLIEVTLAVAYRKQDSDGNYWGGPMYYIGKGINGKIGSFLGKVYAIFLFILIITDSCFVQVNAFASTVHNVIGIPKIICGILWVILGIAILKAGNKRIGTFCKIFAPFMCVIYIISTTIIIIHNYQFIPLMFKEIFYYAFHPTPIIGGFTGSTIMMTLSKGFSRGIFSNEAGQGTSTTIYAKAIVEHPVKAGLYSILEVVADCFICTITGFSVLITFTWKDELEGIALNLKAFHSSFGIWGELLICAMICFFTFSSYISFFIEYCTSLKYLVSDKITNIAKWFYFIPPLFSVTLSTNFIWMLADMAVGFIILPNIMALLCLNKQFTQLWKDYSAK